MRILFAGTPDFAVPTFTGLCEAGHKPVACYTQPDRPAGRGRKHLASPVKRAALEAGVRVMQPASLKGSEEQVELAAFAPELMVVVAYGLLLPRAILDTPTHGCINLHASLLPRWRGAAPIQRAILAGDNQSGVSIMQMDEGLDTGAVWAHRSCTIDEHTTAASLHNELARMGAELLVYTLPAVAARERAPSPQVERQSSYARKLDKAEAAIDWRHPASALARQVRAFNPWPVAQCSGPQGVMRLWMAYAVPQGAVPVGSPGDVLAETSDGISVQTGEGILLITRLQLAGKRQVSAAEFINGRSLLGLSLR